MSLWVTIENYQSIKHVKFEITGFTVLVGKTNIGKSAILRAIEDALTARKGTECIRHGEKFCRVTFEEEGFKLVWEKGKKYTKYFFNDDPVPLEKLGQSGAPEAIRLAGYFGIQFKSDKRSDLPVQFANQAGGDIFLINEHKTALSEIFTLLSRVETWLKAVKTAEKETRDLSAEITVRDKDEVRLLERMSNYEGLDEVLAKVDLLSKIQSALSARQGVLEKAENTLAGLTAVDKLLGDSVGVVSAVLPEISLERPLLLAEAEALFSALNKLRGFITEVSEVNVSLPSIPDFSTVHVAERLYAELQSLEWVKAAAILPPIPKLEIDTTRFSTALSLQTDLQKCSTAIQEIALLLDQAARDLDAGKDEYSALLVELGKCPLCEKELNHD